MIRCDKCMKVMYNDSRSDKDAYCSISILYVDGLSSFHLCKVCHRQLFTEFLRFITPDEYDDEYGWSEEGDDK